MVTLISIVENFGEIQALVMKLGVRLFLKCIADYIFGKKN